MSDYYVPEVICHKVEVMIGTRKQRDLRMFAYENEMLCLKLLLWMRELTISSPIYRFHCRKRVSRKLKNNLLVEYFFQLRYRVFHNLINKRAT